MLLALDIGNTNTVLGLFENDVLIHDWRIRTEVNMTIDEYAITLRSMFAMHGIELNRVSGVIISCVVPPVLNAAERFCRKYFGTEPLVVGPGIKTGMPILYDNPREVGADRIASAVAAFELRKDAVVVVDFGTATTFDFVSERGEYISPGIMISCEALFQKASKLPRVEIFARPPSILAKNTISSMNAGIVFGYAGLVEGIISRIKKEVGRPMHVIATGGLAALIASECPIIDQVDEYLILNGLRIIFERNKVRRAA
jgi:type III pantothenate kinase